MARNITIFGVKFAYPKGLRKSPGSNKRNACIAEKLSGKTGGGRAGVRQRFRQASKEC